MVNQNNPKLLVSNRIDKFIESEHFELSIEYIKYIHKFLFEGLRNDAGIFRTDNLTKQETILNNDTVKYADYSKIETYLKFDLEEERKINYKKLNEELKIKNIANFTIRIWQTHPFSEGNTRTTATILQKYLKFLGYKVDNNLFKNKSEYFRNTLVRGVYSNHEYQIFPDKTYLINFIKKAIYYQDYELNEEVLYIDKLFKNSNIKSKKLKITMM